MEKMRLVHLDDLEHQHIKFEWFLSGTEPDVNVYDEHRYTWANTNDEHYGAKPPTAVPEGD